MRLPRTVIQKAKNWYRPSCALPLRDPDQVVGLSGYSRGRRRNAKPPWNANEPTRFDGPTHVACNGWRGFESAAATHMKMPPRRRRGGHYRGRRLTAEAR